MDIVTIIPARGGSKGVPKKNIALLRGYPLIAYSIAAARLLSSVKRTVVSTDSERSEERR
ncbi:MAG: acylneuraminate cytidylyltransferase family protein, partial [Candidatus Omnitrophota bacterium]